MTKCNSSENDESDIEEDVKQINQENEIIETNNIKDQTDLSEKGVEVLEDELTEQLQDLTPEKESENITETPQELSVDEKERLEKLKEAETHIKIDKIEPVSEFIVQNRKKVGAPTAIKVLLPKIHIF